MARLKPYLVSYKNVDPYGNITDDKESTTTVYAQSKAKASATFQQKANYKVVVTNVRSGGV